ncbi:dysbindin isoform X2 [Chanodichthys erythropterus]|uniref:dysbindin isoform X2 n=1 Tax=Chanodichthys erythropterus TaxID=933992 RepID=UPI00351F59D6
MSSKGTNLHNKRLLSETEHAQRVPDTESAQQMRLRERQRFFEEVFQHDVDVYLSSAHLQIDYKRPPLGSISSMEVNVDMLEQMDLMDISDQETLDVFFSASGEEGGLTSPLPVSTRTWIPQRRKVKVQVNLQVSSLLHCVMKETYQSAALEKKSGRLTSNGHC